MAFTRITSSSLSHQESLESPKSRAQPSHPVEQPLPFPPFAPLSTLPPGQFTTPRAALPRDLDPRVQQVFLRQVLPPYYGYMGPPFYMVQQPCYPGSLPPLCSPAVPQKPSLEELFKQVEDFICKVQTTKGIATGFMVEENLLVVPSNKLTFNPVRGDPEKFALTEGSIFCSYKKEVSVLYGFFNTNFENHLRLGCAVFQVPDPDCKKFKPVKFFQGELKPGRTVYFGQYSEDQEAPTFHKGHISSVSSKGKGLLILQLMQDLPQGVLVDLFLSEKEMNFN